MKIARLIAATLAAITIPFGTPNAARAADVPASITRESFAESSVSAPYCETASQAADYVRSKMLERAAKISFSTQTGQGTNYERFSEIIEYVLGENGRCDAGDYLRFNIKSCYYENKSAGSGRVRFDMTVTYLTSAAQEKKIAQKTEDILDSMKLSGKSDYDKIKAIYEYVVTNANYASGALTDDHYSAYGALFNKSAVCQGYTELFYRLATKAGISCRIIAGTSGAENHVWMIAAVNGLYYYLDPTWDSCLKDGGKRFFFMRGVDDFDQYSQDQKHVVGVQNDAAGVLYPNYKTNAFVTFYPMAKKAYGTASQTAPSFTLGDVNNDGTVDGSDATETLRAYAEANSFGNCGATVIQRKAADVNGDGSVDGNDATQILKYCALRSSGINVTLENCLNYKK